MDDELRCDRRFLHKGTPEDPESQLCQITRLRRGHKLGAPYLLVYWRHVVGDQLHGLWAADDRHFLADALGSWQD